MIFQITNLKKAKFWKKFNRIYEEFVTLYDAAFLTEFSSPKISP